MASLVPAQETPWFAFDQSIKQIYFRNDTDSTYQVVLVPKSMSFEDFPRRSVVISGCEDIEKIICLCKIVPRQCVKICKVRKKLIT
jgi:hypothetical protein